jgi:hypothetical protein
MKVIEGKKYLDPKRFDIAEYMKNFSREQTNDTRQTNNKKLTLADLQNYVNKSSKTFLIDKSDY